ncbi:MAG: hypothetical protein JNM95_12255 [Chitinophagaceae bacterium]|nr:hypothetical protein [Chitinophagaceae bacterium]
MEFRIAPLLMACFLCLYLLFIHPAINASMPLSTASKFSKVLVPVALLFILSLSTYFRHSFYTTRFKAAYWFVQVVNVILLIWFFLFLQQQGMI